jgi:hypothetical protein
MSCRHHIFLSIYPMKSIGQPYTEQWLVLVWALV